ncbi:hypothetical protein [Pseudomonas oryzihabitans]|uniref:hypothetical protein n=1 Tax=Pseudomonas oryzihabitans TaxID=47885 RepID=UPI002B1D5F12|nr:hypothetical protein [Pseudomonas oryzihabitans]
MNTPTKTEHEKKIDSLARDYLQQGFSVIKEPAADAIPLDLGGYIPDLIATKGSLNLIIEVKTKASRVSIDKFQSLAQEIALHDGWRFLLVTLDDVDSSKIPSANDELPTWHELEHKLQQAQSLIAEGALEPAVLYLWSIFEAALRKRAIAQRIPVERLPASMLIKHMYSLGEVSVNDIDQIREFMDKRNRVAHGANEAVDPHQLSLVFQTVNRILTEWSA